MKIEKIDINKMDDLSIWLRAVTDKVNELIDNHNQINNENISIVIDKKGLSSLVSEINSIKTTVTTLTTTIKGDKN